MQISVEAGEGLERRMKVDLPSERIEQELDKRLRDQGRNVRLPGFRPGKVPLKILRQRFGAQMRQEVFGELVQSTFSEAIAAEQLRLAGMPRIEPDIDEAGNHLGYTAVFDVMPELELAPLGGRTVTRPVAAVEESDVDAMIERLREQRKEWHEVDRPAQDGDRLTVAYKGVLEGEEEPFEGGSAEDAKIDLGAGRMIPGFEDGLVGAAAGEQRKLELRFPDGYHAQKLAGRAVSFHVTVGAVAEPVLPELDADFIRSFGIDSGELDGLRSDIRKNMERELKQRIDGRVKEQVMDLLLDANSVELPSAMVQEEIRVLKDQMRQNIGGGTQMELPDNLFEDSAKRRVGLGLIVGEIVKVKKIAADQDRVREAVEDMASTYEEPQQVIDHYYGDRKRLASVESLVLENQVVDWVLDQVDVQDESTTFESLTNPTPNS